MHWHFVEHLAAHLTEGRQSITNAATVLVYSMRKGLTKALCCWLVPKDVRNTKLTILHSRKMKSFNNKKSIYLREFLSNYTVTHLNGYSTCTQKQHYLPFVTEKP